jgi:hypothetical protein
MNNNEKDLQEAKALNAKSKELSTAAGASKISMTRPEKELTQSADPFTSNKGTQSK